jgi:hypothetical protein
VKRSEIEDTDCVDDLLEELFDVLDHARERVVRNCCRKAVVDCVSAKSSSIAPTREYRLSPRTMVKI